MKIWKLNIWMKKETKIKQMDQENQTNKIERENRKQKTEKKRENKKTKGDDPTTVQQENNQKYN